MISVYLLLDWGGQKCFRNVILCFRLASRVCGTNCIGAKHCSSLCSQSEGDEDSGEPIADLSIFATCPLPSLCEQSELQCWRRNRRLCGPAQISAARALSPLYQLWFSWILNTLPIGILIQAGPLPSLCEQSELQCWRRNRRLCGPVQISAARALPPTFNIPILNTLSFRDRISLPPPHPPNPIPMPFGESGTCRARLCSQRRPHLGRATTVSAPRCGRAWDGVRRQVVNLDSLAACWERPNPSTPYINNKQALNIALSACLLLLCGKHVPSRRLVPAEREPYYFL